MVILTQGWAFIGSYKVTADSNQGYYIPVTWFVTSIRNSYFEQKFGHYTCCTSKYPALIFKPTTSRSKAFFHYHYLVDQVVSHSKDEELFTWQRDLVSLAFPPIHEDLDQVFNGGLEAGIRRFELEHELKGSSVRPLVSDLEPSFGFRIGSFVKQGLCYWAMGFSARNWYLFVNLVKQTSLINN